MKKGLIMTLAVLLSFTGLAHAADGEPTTELLWPEGAPGARGTNQVDRPSLTIYLPPEGEANGTAVVICPGGGYSVLVTTYEGNEIAQWFRRQGVVGIVLNYRFAPYKHPVPMEDGQRAIRYVRANAQKLGVDPTRIGMMGFSAGGHVASTVGTHFDAGNPTATDPLERVSCRPDFLLLIYSVISMGSIGHVGSTANLLGASPSEELIDLLSNEKQVTPTTPPTFLAHSKLDRAVSSENSSRFAAACVANGVPVEYLELETGAHGLGCGAGPEWKAWRVNCIAWMEKRGLIPAKKTGD